MAYKLFQDLFPEIAKKETRTVTLTRDYLGLPAGDYTFFEMFCDEPGCDCRRVFLQVVCNAIQDDPLAVIAYGWETREYYIDWFGVDDSTQIDILKGPCLNEASPQSKYAYALLSIFGDSLLPDEAYIDRIIGHYKIFTPIMGDKKIVDFGEMMRRKKLHLR